MNAFSSDTPGQRPLPDEFIQSIHLLALQEVLQGNISAELPARLSLDRLKKMRVRGGPDILLSHPSTLADIFAHVTQAVYQTIHDLYCSRLSRSIHMVWQVIRAMAQQAQAPGISYEAVWAICLSLEKQHQVNLEIAVERSQHVWGVGRISLDCLLWTSENHENKQIAPLLYCVVEMHTGQMLAFRFATEKTAEEEYALVIYDALLSSRCPRKTAPLGTIWHLPQRLMTGLPLPTCCQQVCRVLGIVLEGTADPPPLIQTLQHTWAASIAGRVLRIQQCALLLNTYLDRHSPSGPLSVLEKQQQHYGHLLGYQREPAWQFSLLRALLPQRQGTITENGLLLFQKLHYQNPLLSYWPRRAVTFRLSPHSDALIWIYLEGEILCQAHARERFWQDEHDRVLYPGR